MSKLVASYYTSGTIAWWCDGEEGACLGEISNAFRQPIRTMQRDMREARKKSKFEDFETAYVELEMLRWVKASTRAYRTHSGSFKANDDKAFKEMFDVAKSALSAAKAAWKHEPVVPEWQRIALKHGWAPPKTKKPKKAVKA